MFSDVVDRNEPTPTLSIGVAETIADTTKEMTLHDLLSAADQALYDAKHSNRDCIRIYENENRLTAFLRRLRLSVSKQASLQDSLQTKSPPFLKSLAIDLHAIPTAVSHPKTSNPIFPLVIICILPPRHALQKWYRRRSIAHVLDVCPAVSRSSRPANFRKSTSARQWPVGQVQVPATSPAPPHLATAHKFFHQIVPVAAPPDRAAMARWSHP